MPARCPSKLLAFFCCLLAPQHGTIAGPRYSSRIVEIKTGAIRGVILELNSRHLEPVEIFRGVPYAAPPVGPLRFEPPQPPLAWSGTRLADTFGPVCPQKYPDISNRTAALLSMPKGRYHYLKRFVPYLQNQSEDCLFLNIYVPGSGNRGLEAPYAILVYVHGESFEWGAGHPYDGSVLASYGHVIVITLNYRLGVLGFLRTKPLKSQMTNENLALKDIAACLMWIKMNVAAFGGDPTRVTLVGHDTGAALVNLLFISSSAKGLFKRVILLSGSALSPWALIHNADSLRASIGHQLGCLDPTSDGRDEDLTACMQSRPVEVLLNVELETVRFMPRIAPSLWYDIEIVDPLLAMEHTSENFIMCEVMLGVTSTESYSEFSAADIEYGFEEDQRNRVLRTYVRNTYTYHLNEIFSAIRNEYTEWDKPVQHPINIRDSTLEALSDGHTVSPLIHVAYLHARRGAKTYFFHFGYQTKDSDYPQRLGAVRGEDLIYILGMPLVSGMPFFPQNFSRQDMGLAEAVLSFFSNFIKNGDPNYNGQRDDLPDYGYARDNKYRSIYWEPYEINTQFYLSITLKPKIKSHYRGHKMAVWLNLIPQLHQPGNDDVSMRHHHFHEREPHFYAGPVRLESFTRMPPVLHPAYITDSHVSNDENTECIPNTTENDRYPEVDIRLSEDAESEEILERLSSKHYYSYTAALGVTVGVGCLLLILNMFIFAGIYYQRGRDRRRRHQKRPKKCYTTEATLMTQRPSVSDTVNSECMGKKNEMLPQYTIAQVKSPVVGVENSTIKKPKPPPPARKTSNLSTGTIKKRVHLQEISV